MSNENIEISRRSVLGALGTIGVASGGAGLGTAAFFSDEEVFNGNHLTAGSLDLKLDWQEHYSDWSEDEAEFAGMADSDPDYVLPGGSAAEDIALNISDEDGFMRATAIEAYPDTDDDGLNDYSDLDEDVAPEDVGDICNVGADTPEDLDPRAMDSGGAGTGLRTYRDLDEDPAPGSATIDTGGEEDQILPLISLGDVKPGDFGEVTFSLHLCGNPGYVWLFADDVYWAENGHTEPERKDPDTVGPPDEEGSTAEEDSLADAQVELLDAIRARAWYDIDGDNLKDDGEPLLVGPASLREVLTTLRSGDHGVLIDASKFFGIPQQAVTADSSDDSIPDEAEFECTKYPGNPSCGDLNGYELGVRFDESEIDDGETSTEVSVGGTDYEVFVDITVVDYDGDQPKTITWTDLEVSIDGGPRHAAGAGSVIVKGGPAANVCTPVDPMEPASGAGDQEFQSPTMENNGNVPGISHLDFCIAEIGEDGDNGIPPLEEKGGDPCLPNSTTVHVGFEWWLPIDHGNEVQTDSVAFDLGFYTEQCRHNEVDGGNGTGIQEDGDGDGDGPAFSFIAYCGPEVDSNTSVSHTVLETGGDGAPITVEWQSDDEVSVIRTKSGLLEEEFDGGNQTAGTVTVGDGTELEVQDTNAFASNPCGWDGGSSDGVKYEYHEEDDEFRKE